MAKVILNNFIIELNQSFIQFFLKGNIVLHVFSQKAREVFDLESLWSVGAKYDDQVNFQDPQTEIFEKYDAFLKELQPADG